MVENSILNQQRELFLKTHAHAFVTIDEWIGLTMDDIRRLEADVASKSADELKATIQASAAVPHHSDRRERGNSTGGRERGSSAGSTSPRTSGAVAAAIAQ